MNSQIPRRSRILQIVLAVTASLTLAACGGSDDDGGGATTPATAPAPAPAGETADLTAVCAAMDDMAKGIDALRNVDMTTPTGPSDVAGRAAEIGDGLPAITAALPSLPEADREAVEAANESFRSSFLDATLALTDVVRAGDTAALEAQAATLSEAFDEAYGDIDCP